MWQAVLHAIGRKNLVFLGLSLGLLLYLAFVRNDTTRSDLAIAGGMVLALWLLTGVRAYMRLGATRRHPPSGTTNAR